MTTLQIAVASADAFVILTGSSITGNLLAGWIAKWLRERRLDRDVARMDREMARLRSGAYPTSFGIVRAPMPGGRCEHLRVRELCDDCNEPKKGA